MNAEVDRVGDVWMLSQNAEVNGAGLLKRTFKKKTLSVLQSRHQNRFAAFCNVKIHIQWLLVIIC